MTICRYVKNLVLHHANNTEGLSSEMPTGAKSANSSVHKKRVPWLIFQRCCADTEGVLGTEDT